MCVSAYVCVCVRMCVCVFVCVFVCVRVVCVCLLWTRNTNGLCKLYECNTVVYICVHDCVSNKHYSVLMKRNVCIACPWFKYA